MICKNCGKEIPNDSNFCQYCRNIIGELQETKIVENNNKEEINLTLEDSNFENEPKEISKKIDTVLWCLFTFIICLLFGMLIHSNTVNKYKNEISDKEKEIITLKEMNITLGKKNIDLEVFYKAKANFLDDYIVIVGDTNVYHKYDCKLLDFTNGFYAFNIENAIAQGYSECPKCIK